jgi:hypothetical protein
VSEASSDRLRATASTNQASSTAAPRSKMARFLLCSLVLPNSGTRWNTWPKGVVEPQVSRSPNTASAKKTTSVRRSASERRLASCTANAKQAVSASRPT